MITRRWAVVQDLRPFAINVHHRCFTRRSARLWARVSPHYTVMTFEDARRLEGEAWTALQEHRWDFKNETVRDAPIDDDQL